MRVIQTKGDSVEDRGKIKAEVKFVFHFRSERNLYNCRGGSGRLLSMLLHHPYSLIYPAMEDSSQLQILETPPKRRRVRVSHPLESEAVTTLPFPGLAFKSTGSFCFLPPELWATTSSTPLSGEAWKPREKERKPAEPSLRHVCTEMQLTCR